MACVLEENSPLDLGSGRRTVLEADSNLPHRASMSLLIIATETACLSCYLAKMQRYGYVRSSVVRMRFARREKHQI